uniref:Uncharacterized protein n=1 Tax=Romanomermis culicivorax TaxID=13658 RepID=A0A915JE42_ROMCU
MLIGALVVPTMNDQFVADPPFDRKQEAGESPKKLTKEFNSPAPSLLHRYRKQKPSKIEECSSNCITGKQNVNKSLKIIFDVPAAKVTRMGSHNFFGLFRQVLYEKC